MGYAEESEVWKPVQEQAERIRIFHGLAAKKGEVHLEGRDAECVFSVREAAGESLKVEMRAEEPIPFRPQEVLTVKFGYADESYFFRCAPQFEGSRATLTPAEDLFQLQRRKTFRIPIPKGFPSRMELSFRHNGKLPLLGSIVNINAFGIAFETDGDEKFEMDEKIEGEVQLGERKSAKVAGLVRHVRSIDGKTQIGVKFDHSVHHSQDAVQTILAFFRHDSFYFNKKK